MKSLEEVIIENKNLILKLASKYSKYYSIEENGVAICKTHKLNIILHFYYIIFIGDWHEKLIE